MGDRAEHSGERRNLLTGAARMHHLRPRGRAEDDRLEYIWADQGYAGKGKSWIEAQLGWSVEIVQHPPRPRGEWRWVTDPDDPTRTHFERFRLPPVKKEFRGILPRRWVAGRTFSWLSQSRRLSKECERLCATRQATIYAIRSRIMLRRLAHG